ncbi:DUF1189 domain-containing protein, partial [bacterium]|nr:DUF1189 domain-containing protein [bacterium]
MDNDTSTIELPSEPVAKQGEGCLGELTWLGMGLTLPIVNLNFYRKAAYRKVSSALLVFFVFALFITVLTTINVSKTLNEGGQGIQKAFDEGSFPTITIRDGIAQVNGPQPFIISDYEGSLIAIDTTGELSEIDRSIYYQGILLTRTELQILNKGEYRTITLVELQQAFNQNPIVLDKTNVLRLWKSFSSLAIIVGFFGIALWNMLLRLGYLALLALLIWPVVSLFKRGTGYQTVFSTGVYVLIPAMLLHYIISRNEGGFFGDQTLILLPLWGLALAWVLSKPKEEPANITILPLKMLIAIPLLGLIAVDVLVNIPNGDIFLWGAAEFTLLAAVATGPLFPAKDKSNNIPPPPIEPLP